jgi:hypothetical protein
MNKLLCSLLIALAILLSVLTIVLSLPLWIRLPVTFTAIDKVWFAVATIFAGTATLSVWIQIADLRQEDN